MSVVIKLLNCRTKNLYCLRVKRAKSLKYALADFVRDCAVKPDSHCFNTLNNNNDGKT